MKLTYPAPSHDWLQYTHVFIKTTVTNWSFMMDLFLKVSLIYGYCLVNHSVSATNTASLKTNTFH